MVEKNSRDSKLQIFPALVLKEGHNANREAHLQVLKSNAFKTSYISLKLIVSYY